MSKNTGTSELINYFDLGASGAVGIGGNLTLSTIANATVDTDKFLVSDNGIVKYRTGAQLLSDIGGQVSGNYVTLDTNQSITGVKTFGTGSLILAANGTASPTIIRNTSGTTGSTGGFNTIGFNSNNNIFVDTTNSGGFIFDFNNSVSNRTYTLQNSSGTLAFTSDITSALGSYVTLATSQSITGSKTFTNSILLKNSPSLPGLILSSYSANALEIGATISGTTYYSSIVFPAGAQSWNLPNASGTIALTSNLAAYLPLAGGNLTGPLGGTSLNFSGDVQSGTRLIAATGGQQIILTPNLGGGTNRIEATGGLPLAIVTTGASLTLAAGGVTPQFTLSSAGLVTLTGALNGTSASFTGNLLMGFNNPIRLGNSPYRFSIYRASSGNLITYFDDEYDVSNTSIRFRMRTSGTPIEVLTLASTGAATFSSSVTAKNYGISEASAFRGGLYTFNQVFGSGTDYSVGLFSESEIYFAPGGSATKRVVLTNSGNVLIGTTTDNGAKLQVSGRVQGQEFFSVGSLNDTDGSFLIDHPGTQTWKIGITNNNTSTFSIGNDNGGAFAAKYFNITNAGNVGIGTATPQDRLDINGSLRIRLNTPNFTSVLDNLVIDFVPTAVDPVNPRARIAAIGTASIGSNIDFLTGISSTLDTRMRITSGGNVLIGTTTDYGSRVTIEKGNSTEASPHFNLYNTVGYGGFHFLDGTAYYIGQNSNFRSLRIYSGGSTGTGVNLAAGATSWGTYSDERLKNNIENIGSVLPRLLNLRTVKYHLKNVDTEHSQKRLGLIAQDLVGNFDEVLSQSKYSDEDETEYYEVRYTELIPILIKAIQEQQEQIDKLTKK